MALGGHQGLVKAFMAKNNGDFVANDVATAPLLNSWEPQIVIAI